MHRQSSLENILNSVGQTDCLKCFPILSCVVYPHRSGGIFDADFVCGMEQAGRGLKLGKKDQQLLSALHTEAICSSGNPTPTCDSTSATM